MASSYAPSNPHREVEDYLGYVDTVLARHQQLDAKWDPPVRLGFAAASERVGELRGRFREPFRLAVVGEFKAGKSTLINALLSAFKLLPEGVVATTGAVTELWWGSEPSGEVFDGRGVRIFEGTREECLRYADQNTEQGARLSGTGGRVIVRSDIPLLRNLVILDTPGLGSSERDDRTTLDSLELADAAILVVSALQPGGEDSVDLAERLRSARRRLITVVARVDQVSDPQDAVLAAKRVFGGVSDGDPIPVSARRIQAAIEKLRAAEQARDEQGVKEANRLLEESGHIALHERLDESFLSGTAGSRSARVLADVGTLVHQLEVQAAQAAGRSDRSAREAESALKESERVVAEVLRPKIPYIDAKISETVDLHVREYIAELEEAADLFLDKLHQDRLQLGFGSLFSRRSEVERSKFQRQMRDKFKSLFPDDELDMTVQKIARGTSLLLELEWAVISGDLRSARAGAFDLGPLADQIADNAAQAAAAMAFQLGALLGILVLPGGALLDGAVLIGRLATGAGAANRGPQRLALAKREAKVRIRRERRALTHKLSEHFQTFNRTTADELIARTRSGDAELTVRARTLADDAKAWKRAADDLRGLMEDSDGVGMKSTGGLA